MGGLATIALMPVPQAAAWPIHPTDICYRDDPRPAGDLPVGIESNREPEPMRPAGRRRMTRRAQRRAWRRGNWEEASGPTSRIGGLDAGLPVDPHGRLRIDHRDIPYGSGSDHHRFDIFLPGGCRQAQLPLVVWLPGDDWSTIDRGDCPIQWLTSHGYAVATIGYRPTSAGRFPAQRDDCRAALCQLADDAALWGINPDRIAVVGRAGGGHLAALLGLDAPQSATAPAEPTASVRIAAVCSLSPITHLPTLGPEHDRGSSAASRLIGGPLPELREAALEASPLRYASPDDPPILLIHTGTALRVPVSQSERLHAALQAAGVDSRLVISDQSEPTLSADSRVGQLLLAFLNRKLAVEPSSIVVAEPLSGLGDG